MNQKFLNKLAHSLMIIVTFGLLAAPSASTVAQTPAATPVASPVAITPAYEEAECMYDLPSGLTEGEDVICGWVTAPMFPDGSRPGEVKLAVIRILATTDTPAEDPLMILLGGPGQNMSAVLPAFGDEYPLYDFMLDRQDVILFDQRGMGMSTPTLACPFERIDDDGTTMADPNVGLLILRCGADLLEDGINPTAFTTENNAADIEAIRIAMGYEQVNLYGISYGSKLALSAVRDYPDSIRSTIISSPLPLEQNPFADQTIGFDHALKQVWDACAADDICSAENPDPAGDFVRAVDRLKTDPVTVTATIPATGQPMEIQIDNYQFMQILYLAVFVGDFVSMVPYLVSSVAQGDDSVLQMFAPVMLADGGASLGAMFTYFCQDEVPFSPQSETDQIVRSADLAPPFTDGSWISLGDQGYMICAMWPFPEADEIEHEPVVSDEPMLIFTGTFDPITPASNGEIVAANFPNSQLVNFTAQGHDPASYVPDCSGPMINSYLDDPTAPVDAGCADAPVDFSMPDLEEYLATPVASPVPPIVTEAN